MITITPNKDGLVVRIGYRDETLAEGAIEVSSIPDIPETANDEAADLYWIDGNLIWKVTAVPPPEPEPEEPHIPTAEEITEMRKSAYISRVDPITCEIERLKEMGGTPEEIEAARYRRAEEVAAIKAEYPYPEI